MKKQARDIAKTSNGKVVLVAADELKVTSSFYGSIDEGFFTFMNRIHRFIDCFVTAYSTNIMKMKFNNEQNWKQNKN